jgi:hypothetical protein
LHNTDNHPKRSFGSNHPTLASGGKALPQIHSWHNPC